MSDKKRSIFRQQSLDRLSNPEVAIPHCWTVTIGMCKPGDSNAY